METDATRLRVIQYFLSKTPVGEHKEVLAELQALLGTDLIHSEAVANTLLKALASHGTTIPYEGNRLQMTPTGYISGSSFYDPKFDVNFNVDPYDLLVSNVTKAKSGSKLLKIVQEQLDFYLSQYFLADAQGRTFENGQGLLIFIACPCVNLKNMWTGEWISTWELTEGKIKGTVTINAHYFEEGNMQLSHTDTFEREILVKNSEENIAKEVIKQIRKCDAEVQSEMDELYENLPSGVFKPMRRTMPVTHTKFAEMYKAKMLS